MKTNDKNETVDKKSDDTEIGKLISEIGRSGDPELAEAVEAVHDGLAYAKRLTAIAFDAEAAKNPTLVLEVYDRINDIAIDDDDDADDSDREEDNGRRPRR